MVYFMLRIEKFVEDSCLLVLMNDEFLHRFLIFYAERTEHLVWKGLCDTFNCLPPS
jgi:hypothetical protein